MLRSVLLLALLGALSVSACAPAQPPSDEPRGGAPIPTETPPPDAPVSATPLPPNAAPPPLPSAPYAPRPGDEALTRGPVFLNGHKLVILESYPPQFVLRLNGTLPNPCYQLRVAVAPPDAQNRIQIEMYSLVAGAQVCIEVLKEFEQAVPLGSFPSGHYTLWINGERISEFDA